MISKAADSFLPAPGEKGASGKGPQGSSSDLLLCLAALCLVFLILLVDRGYSADWICNCDAGLCAAYDKALEETKKPPTPDRISKALTAITREDEKLIWKRFTDDEGRDVWRVLVAFYGNPLYPDPGQLPNPNYSLGTNKWITAVPEVYDYFKPRPFTTTRLEERLGLPPCYNKPKVVELWVDPANLFRPSPDPEIIDHEASLDFPWKNNNFIRMHLYNPDTPGDQTALVWDDYCKPTPCIADTHKNEYEAWFTNRKSNIYSKQDNTPFPWTGLGYSYDYGPSANGVGFSEFVVLPSFVGVQRQEDVATYFRPHRQTISISKEGSGRISSRPPGIQCGSFCKANFSRYARVTVTATPARGWRFAGWSGACADAGDQPACSISMYDDQTVGAVFVTE
jgi:hypothetical protein